MPRTTIDPDFFPWTDFLDDIGRSRQFGDDHQGEEGFPKKYRMGSRVSAYRPETERYKRAILSQSRPEPEPKRPVGRPRKTASSIAANRFPIPSPACRVAGPAKG